VALLKGEFPDFPGLYSTISSQQSRGFIKISPGEIIQAGARELATIPRRYFQFIELTYNIPGNPYLIIVPDPEFEKLVLGFSPLPP
jgi:hypothetical protein